MQVSLIINHYKTPEILRMSLGYFLKWKKELENKGVDAEIIVTDSEAMARTKEMLQDEFEDVIYIGHEKNVGFGKSNNSALKKAEGKYVFIANADIVLHEAGELQKLIEYMEKNKEVGIAGPKLLNFDDTHQPSAFRYYTPYTILARRTFIGKTKKGKQKLQEFTLEHQRNLLKEPTEVDWLMGSALLVRKEYLDQVGAFDERFFMYMEDVDLCRRFWNAGYKVVYFPGAKMYHFHGKASGGGNVFTAIANKYARVHLTSAWKYFRKHGLKTPRYGA